MSALRSTKQRNAVLHNLQERYDHPTAEDVYLSVKEAIPGISLATVYRNLRLLEREGQILRLTTENGDRFDGHTHRHYHFTCTTCKQVSDVEISGDITAKLLPKDFDGTVTGHELMFFGRCPHCKAL